MYGGFSERMFILILYSRYNQHTWLGAFHHNKYSNIFLYLLLGGEQVYNSILLQKTNHIYNVLPPILVIFRKCSVSQTLCLLEYRKIVHYQFRVKNKTSVTERSIQSSVWAPDSVRQSWVLYVLDWDWDVKKVSVSTGKYWQWDRANWVTVIVDDRDERERESAPPRPICGISELPNWGEG